MAGKFFIRIVADTAPAADAPIWQGAYYDALGHFVSQQPQPSTLAALREFAQAYLAQDQDARLIVLLPGESVLLTTVKAPTRQTRQLRQAAPFLVEDQLAEELDALQVVVAVPAGRSEQAVVGCIQRERLARYLELLAEHGLEPEVMLPDAVLVPRTAEGWGILLDGARALVHTEALQGFSIESELLLLALDQLQAATGEGEAADAKETPHQCVMPSAEAERHKLLLAQLEAQMPRLMVEMEPLSAFEILAHGYLRQARQLEALNLLQGDFLPRRQRVRQRSPWRAAAILAGVWLVLHSGLLFYQGYVHAQQAEQVQQQAEALYRSLFPQDKRLINLKVQMQNHLRQGSAHSAPAGVLPLLLAAGEALRDAKLQNELTIARFSYNEFQGDLALELAAKSFNHLDRYRQALTEVGFTAEINGVSNADNGVKANMLIKSGGRS